MLAPFIEITDEYPALSQDCPLSFQHVELQDVTHMSFVYKAVMSSEHQRELVVDHDHLPNQHTLTNNSLLVDKQTDILGCAEGV